MSEDNDATFIPDDSDDSDGSDGSDGSDDSDDDITSPVDDEKFYGTIGSVLGSEYAAIGGVVQKLITILSDPVKMVRDAVVQKRLDRGTVGLGDAIVRDRMDDVCDTIISEATVRSLKTAHAYISTIHTNITQMGDGTSAGSVRRQVHRETMYLSSAVSQQYRVPDCTICSDRIANVCTRCECTKLSICEQCFIRYIIANGGAFQPFRCHLCKKDDLRLDDDSTFFDFVTEEDKTPDNVLQLLSKIETTTSSSPHSKRRRHRRLRRPQMEE